MLLEKKKFFFYFLYCLVLNHLLPELSHRSKAANTQHESHMKSKVSEEISWGSKSSGVVFHSFLMLTGKLRTIHFHNTLATNPAQIKLSGLWRIHGAETLHYHIRHYNKRGGGQERGREGRDTHQTAPHHTHLCKTILRSPLLAGASLHCSLTQCYGDVL